MEVVVRAFASIVDSQDPMIMCCSITESNTLKTRRNKQSQEQIAPQGEQNLLGHLKLVQFIAWSGNVIVIAVQNS